MCDVELRNGNKAAYIILHLSSCMKEPAFMRLSIQKKIGYFEFNKKKLKQAFVSHAVNPKK
jgi:hypothetical protein